MSADWSSFYVAAAGAAAALTGLLFVAVSLRPREIRGTPLMAGRARSAFYAFAAVLFASFVSLAPTSSTVIGAMQLVVGLGVLALSAPFTLTALRTGQLNYARASVYHVGLTAVAVAGGLRALSVAIEDDGVLLGVGTMLLLGIALANSWQLVISHGDPPTDPTPRPPDASTSARG